MDTKQLKAKILDLAVHGKLLPLKTLDGLKNSPDYEPASKLLEKLRAEKEEKIAKGELKRDKKDSYIFVGDDNRHYEKFADGSVKDIEDEIPFEAPEGWAWCRLGDCSKVISKGTTPKGGKTAYRTDGVNFLRIENLNDNGSINHSNIFHISFEEHETNLKRSKLEEGDLLISIAGTLGKVGFVTKADLPMNTNQAIAFVRLRKYIFDNMFLKYAIESPSVNYKLLLKTKVTSIPNLTLEMISDCLLPLPPISEQKLIVAEIEKIFNLIDSLETDKSSLQLAVKQAKSKILDLAIHGKLVPQDPADEPASVLLEKLRAEKEAKIAKGELKRDKNDSYIYKSTTDNCHYEKFSGKEAVCIEDEIPFEIPDSWQWTKLGRICTKLIDGDHNPPKEIEEKTDYIMASSRNINHDCVEDLKNVRYLTKEMFEIENQRTKAEKGDIFFTSVGTLGRSCIYDGNLNICFQRSVSILKTQIENKYLKYFFDSSFYQDYVLEHATGTAQLGFYLQEMSESYIAIPPISEQKRIVSKIEELFEALDKIQSNLV